MSDLRRSDVTGWVGWIVFAGFFMIINGIFGGLQGLSALLRDQTYFVVGENGLLTFNYTAWGWIHLILGIVLIFVGIFLLRGRARLWARKEAWLKMLGTGLQTAPDTLDVLGPDVDGRAGLRDLAPAETGLHADLVAAVAVAVLP